MNDKSKFFIFICFFLLVGLFLISYFVFEKDVCGDGSVDAGEQCDDGNLTVGDGCSADCTVSFNMEVGSPLFVLVQRELESLRF
ncbi:MAG: DUF4215 domain-containing protein [bacterium]